MHQVIASKAHTAARQTHGPLTLLAAFGWYLKLLFSRVSHLNKEDRKYFNAICGLDTHGVNPYITGQVVFTMASLWPRDRRCPTVNSSVELSMNDIMALFKVSSSTVLSNLVSGRDRSYRPGGPARIAFPDIEWLLRRVPRQSNPIRAYLSQEYDIENPFHDPEDILHGLSADGVVEAIFVAMARSVWNKIPYTRRDSRDVPNLAPTIDAAEVRETWGVEKFRQTVERQKKWFKGCRLAEKNLETLWNTAFSGLFGVIESGQWLPLDSKHGITKLGYYSKWQSFMLAIQGKAVQQTATYRLMKSKFDTLLGFPELKKTARWKTTRVSDLYHVWIISNPNVCNGRMAGYEVF